MPSTQVEGSISAGQFSKQSSCLPFGQAVPLSSVSGPTYVTGQLLVQQIAYVLSDKIFSYSPESFDLDVAVKDWAARHDKNIYGSTTTVLPLQTRTGAGAFALGYIFSKDFDLSKRHIPQTLLAPSLSLRHLRSALDQLSLLYGVASPFVAHVAAVDYSSENGLIAEYGSALQISEELGLALVSSASAYESQHMSLFATLLAKVLPTLHLYDGVRTFRETLRVIDTLSQTGVADLFNKLSQFIDNLNTRLDSAGKTFELLEAFNAELGTEYQPFEYVGHESPDTVFVVFGSVEAQLAKQVVSKLAATGVKIGVVSVRIYRPFIEEAFIKVLPASVRNIHVLGQVSSDAAVSDLSVQSVLYSDVLTAVAFSLKWASAPEVVDIKYSASQILTPTSLAAIVSKSAAESKIQLAGMDVVKQYVFWDTDDSAALLAPTIVADLLSQDSTRNIYLDESYDNLIQGGAVRTDLRSSKKVIDAPYPVEEANIAVLNDEKLLRNLAISQTVKDAGSLLLRLPNFKPEEVEKRVPESVRQDIQKRNLALFVLDPALAPALEADADAIRLLIELSFLKIAGFDLKQDVLQKLSQVEASQAKVEECIEAIGTCLKQIEIPESWAELSNVVPCESIKALKNSFVTFDKHEAEPLPQLSHWQAAAKGLVFKEAYATSINLRPDQTVKTYTIQVKENRRLTPTTYDRNIFHIEFDLGNSGLTYNIGEALGIHAENDPEMVVEFIESYGLDAGALVQVPSRDSPEVLETRTIYQTLTQNIDIFGKPPKRFYELLAAFATDDAEKKKLATLGSQEGADEFKRRSEVDTVTFADILEEFKSARPHFAELVRLVGPLKRREYSIASAQAITPNAVALMIVVVDWVDSRGRTRFGQATRYLSRLPVGATITASVKPSVMKLPTRDDAPLIMAGLGTGLAPFRAFVQYRAMQKAQGKDIGPILLYLGSRHQREEYLYGEEWEAYLDAGVISLLGSAFSRDQPHKIYIQDRMRQTISEIVDAYIKKEGSFYLCGPTWPVPDVTDVLKEAIAAEAKISGRKVDPTKEIDRLKEDGRYVLEVY